MSLYILILCMKLLSNYIYHQVDTLQWEAISLSRHGPLFSHVFFADDLTLISKATPLSIHNMANCMSYFCKLSGQKINCRKFKAFFSKSCPNPSKVLTLQCFSIRESHHFGKYLVFPILTKKSRAKDFQYILDNMMKKLSSWKTKFLTLMGRLVLAKSSLNAISVYTMQYFHFLKITCNFIDKIQHDFLWGSTVEKKKLHLLAWEKISSPIEKVFWSEECILKKYYSSC